MAALAERRIIPHDELKARAEEKSEAEARPEHMPVSYTHLTLPTKA